MRVLIGCGGTGGHIYPAIAIAHELKEQDPNVDILFVGTRGGMEMDLVPNAGYPIMSIDIRGLKRGKIAQNLGLPFLMLKSLYQARKIIKLFKPNVAIGTGGYACFPTLLAAYTKNIPTLIQEQNSSAGLTNRLLSRFVDKICTGYTAVVLPCSKEKTVVTGNPVRSSIYRLEKERAEALTFFALSPSKKCLLVVGGSGGAGKLNTTILAGIEQINALNIQLIWITGSRYFKTVNDYLTTHHVHDDIRCYPFLNNIEMAYAAADVVIARAGALSIAELCIMQKPTILIPSPNVIGDHQSKNALPLATQGAAIVINESACSDSLITTSIDLIYDVTKQQALKTAMQVFSLLHANAADKIVKEIFDLTRP
ncbi:undecaprenyldiphospho-muramoylpentapeptide beta-N-acetylglucosaminyltransferase [Cardinium endosymbiont of Tipula unca]|uniref:undecaprenyldiphospho-muramoylpentapeptide beta-N-acetylglucosaminyltransferase n=1 Tax=Cardinium endosymbiont of Tipula unca TaxID=3066216 RepID=UPI0030D18EDA